MKIGIIGTGLIGASIGLRLKSHGDKKVSVLGYDINSDNINLSNKIQAIDSKVKSLKELLIESNLIIIAIPILEIKSLFEQITKEINANEISNIIITDTASTKDQIIEWADQILPKHISFIGGHPMAGSTEVGPNYSDASLFEGSRWVLTPTKNTPKNAIDTVLSLIEAMGAEPMFMDGKEHDSYSAAISHMPLFLQYGLFILMRNSNAWGEMSMLASSGFKSATRLAGTNPSLAFDINTTNRKNIAHWLTRYIDVINQIKELLENEKYAEDFFRFIGTANLDYLKFEDGAIGREHWGEPLTDVPDFNAFDLLMGGMLTDKLNKLDFNNRK
jgi:prephenate dehydrogenase|tara:strand:- start:764 stop:1756 length:993 start_codon:yes stop_codon:yes gene_type:complete